MYKKNKPMAKFIFNVHKKTATINNIEVYHKNQGIGSIILKDIEGYVLKKYGVYKINVCAWQQMGSTDVLNFYKKNGYVLSDEKSTFYDDTIYIYDLYTLEKKT
jgi:hypothetical protein